MCVSLHLSTPNTQSSTIHNKLACHIHHFLKTSLLFNLVSDQITSYKQIFFTQYTSLFVNEKHIHRCIDMSKIYKGICLPVYWNKWIILVWYDTSSSIVKNFFGCRWCPAFLSSFTLTNPNVYISIKNIKL